MSEIIILGSSSGDPSPTRASSSIILRIGKSNYQFDAGEGFSSSARRHKVDHAAIRAVFISHMHPDHITGVFLEIQMMYLAKRRDPLPLYVPSEAVEPIRQFMKATYLFEDKLGFELPIRPIQPDPVFRDNNIAVYARLNSHLEKNRPVVEKLGVSNRLQSYSFIIKTAKEKIIYSGDVGSVDDYSDLLPGCDLLITEGLHLDLEKLFDVAAENNVNTLILTHLSDDTYRKPTPIIKLAKKHGVEKLVIASDGFSLKL